MPGGDGRQPARQQRNRQTLIFLVFGGKRTYERSHLHNHKFLFFGFQGALFITMGIVNRLIIFDNPFFFHNGE